MIELNWIDTLTYTAILQLESIWIYKMHKPVFVVSALFVLPCWKENILLQEGGLKSIDKPNQRTSFYFTEHHSKSKKFGFQLILDKMVAILSKTIQNRTLK